jgi:hypothetical protein
MATASRWIAAGAWALTASACGQADIDQPWGLGERRTPRQAGDVRKPDRREGADANTDVRRPDRSEGADANTDVMANPSDAAFSVVVPLGVERRLLALAARDSLSIGSDAWVTEARLTGDSPRFAFVSSAGRMRIGSGARVGSVYAMGDDPPEIEGHAVLHGYLKMHAPLVRPLRLAGTTDILDRVEPFVEQFAWAIPTAMATGTAGPRTRTGGGRTTVDLPPGFYRDVVVEAGSATVLHAGEYVFDSLDLREQGVLEMRNTEGPIHVWVRRALVLRGRTLDDADVPNLLFGYAGGEALALVTSFSGTLVAPRAEVTLSATDTPHRGSFFARSIVVSDGAQVEHRAYAPDSTVDAPALVCGRCDTAVREAAEACCVDRRRLTDAARFAVSACAAECDPEPAPGASSCAATCASSAAERLAGARAAHDACLERLPKVQHECERHYGYSPDACSRLGFEPSAGSCGD